MKQVVAIGTSSFAEYDPAPLALLEAEGFEVRRNPYGRRLSAEETRALCRDAIGLVAGTEPLSGAVLAGCRRLVAISRCGAGLDNVDRDWALRAGVAVASTPDAPVAAVAELTVGLVLALLRGVPSMDQALRAGRWSRRMGHLLGARRVGIIGYGRIGRRVAELLAPFGCELAHADPAAPPEPGRLPLEELLVRSDLVTLHAATAEPILGAEELDRLPRGAWVVNLARGGAVDEQALYERLADGRLGGAALDVFGREPYDGPLAALENVVLTPHAGSYAREARCAMEREAVRNLLELLSERGGQP